MTLANDINRFFDKPANRRKVLLGIGGYCLVAVAFSGLQRLSERVAAPAPAPAPVAVAAPAPVAEPAHELAWLAQDPAMAKRMFAECGDLSRLQCERYWEIKRPRLVPVTARPTASSWSVAANGPTTWPSAARTRPTGTAVTASTPVSTEVRLPEPKGSVSSLAF